MSTAMFACPSPSGRNNAGLYLDTGGSLRDRHGNYWGKSQIRRMAHDAALAPEPSGEPQRSQRSTAEWAQSHARTALYEALGEACREHELTDDEHTELRDLIDQHLSGEAQADKGAGAVDRDKGAAALDDDEVFEKVREILRSKGLDDETIERAIEVAKKDRAEAKDRLPVPATRGGMGGYRSGRSKDRYDETDFAKDYPESVTTADPYGEPVSRRLERDADPAREAGERAAARLPGGGVSRRLAAGDAVPCATDEEMAREYGEGFLVTTEGVFGR
jgi:hypothetical protein